jgi:hypothetical protein
MLLALVLSCTRTLQGQESIQFQDVLCQMIDMVRPKNPLAITIEDMMPPSKRMYCGESCPVLLLWPLLCTSRGETMFLMSGGDHVGVVVPFVD